jgi:ATP-binding cassette subfamily F protein uup
MTAAGARRPRLTEDHVLTASHLHAEYGDNTIFDGLSLTLSGTRRVGLVGPNGAGKTTLLRLLAGVEAPRRGRVTLRPGDVRVSAAGAAGRRPQDRPAARRRARRSSSARSAGGRCRPSSTARATLGIAHVPLDAPLGGPSGGEAARAAGRRAAR